MPQRITGDGRAASTASLRSVATINDPIANLTPELRPTAETMRSLTTALEEWLPSAQCGEKQRAAHKTMTAYVAATARAGSPVSDLPNVLRQLKVKLGKDGHPAQFNRVRSSVQRFLRDTFGKRHPIYKAAADVAPLEETKQRKNNPQTVAAVMDLARKIEARHVGALWGMALTGMGPKEFFNGWKIEGTGVHVPGTKRKARDRVVPLVMADRFSAATGERELTTDHRARRFGKALAKASDDTVQPYDLRRTYATWMEAAQIPRSRRRRYMGHAIGDVTELYEQDELERYLSEDAAKLEAFVRAGEKETLKIEGRQA